MGNFPHKFKIYLNTSTRSKANYNIIVIVFFTSIYLISYILVKNKLRINSKIIKQASEHRLRIIRNGFGANKEIIANNLQLYFKNIFLTNLLSSL